MAPVLANLFVEFDRGRRFEQAVGIELMTRYQQVTYWREGNDEVDFIVKTAQKLIAIEVKSGRKKGLGGLNKFMALFPQAIPIIVTPENFRQLPELLNSL